MTGSSRAGLHDLESVETIAQLSSVQLTGWLPSHFALNAISTLSARSTRSTIHLASSLFLLL